MRRVYIGFRTCLLMALLGAAVLSGCKPPEDHIIYEVNSVDANAVDAPKTTLKTDEQYISILYSNLFQRSLSANQLFEIKDLIESVGDKETVHEVILSSFMNSPDKIIPTDLEMRSNLDQFIENTYLRFYVRHPSQAEKAWFRNFIATDPNVSPELVYMAFALSNEYLYY